MHVFKQRKQDIHDLAEYCASETANGIFIFRRGNSPAEILKRARKTFFRNGNFRTLLQLEKNVSYNQTIMAPFLQRALYGDQIAQSYYESFRDISIFRLSPWLREAAESFATDKLNEKSWDSLLDENIIKQILKSYTASKINAPRSIDPSKKTFAGELIKKEFNRYSCLSWLGLFKFSSHWRYNRFIDLCAERAQIKDDFSYFWYGFRTTLKIVLMHRAPTYTKTSIFHHGYRPEILRKVGKETSDFILAGQIIEDTCKLWQIPLTDEQKASLTKNCWKAPWNSTSARLTKRMEVILMFIDQHSELFRSEREQSEFLLEALTSDRLSTTLSDKEINLNKRKTRAGSNKSDFGKNSSMKQFFNVYGEILEQIDPELNISGKDLYYWWKISTDAASDQLCGILLITDKKILIESLLEWKKANINESAPTYSAVAVNEPENIAPLNNQNITQEDIILVDELEGVKTPFNGTFEKISKSVSDEVINAIMDRLTRLRQGHWGDYKHIESIKGVRELRIHQDQGWRIYLYKIEENKFLLLDVCPKCDQQRDIERLKSLIRT